jgi:hypothetical protein
MRGDDDLQEGMFSYISPEKRVPADHPLRPIRKMVDEILKEMSPKFAKLYSDVGRPSIAPEIPSHRAFPIIRLDRALLCAARLSSSDGNRKGPRASWLFWSMRYARARSFKVIRDGRDTWLATSSPEPQTLVARVSFLGAGP